MPKFIDNRDILRPALEVASQAFETVYQRAVKKDEQEQPNRVRGPLPSEEAFSPEELAVNNAIALLLEYYRLNPIKEPEPDKNPRYEP